MKKSIAAIAVTTVASFGSLAAQAGANPTATICGSVSVTINGQSVLNESQCQVLPPEGR
jgi:type 1 fimbria pilin